MFIDRLVAQSIVVGEDGNPETVWQCLGIVNGSKIIVEAMPFDMYHVQHWRSFDAARRYTFYEDTIGTILVMPKRLLVTMLE